MIRFIFTCAIIIGVTACQANTVGVTDKGVPGLDERKIQQIVKRNLPLVPGDISRSNYTGEACTPDTNKGCWRNGVMFDDEIIVIPKHKFLEGPYSVVGFIKNGKHNPKVIKFRTDTEYFALGKAKTLENSAITLDVVEPAEVKDNRIIIAFYDGRAQRILTRVGVATESAKIDGGAPLLKIQTDRKKGDVGAAVLTVEGQLVGMIVDAPETLDQNGYRYAIPAPYMLERLEEKPFYWR